jgi:hypothetical protein
VNENESEGGFGAVPGPESHEREETLSEDERGEEPKPPDYVAPVDRPPTRRGDD